LKELDKFYTKPEVVDTCLDFLNVISPIENFDTILEPSCGSGAFSSKLPKRTINLDIKPEYLDALKQDFLEYQDLHRSNGKKILTIGNPPFGRISSLAIKFFNHASLFSDTIAFIVPQTFKRISVQNKLNRNMIFVNEVDLPKGSFIPETMQAKCVFQVWRYNRVPKKKVVLKLRHKDFEFISIPERGKADIAIKAYGGTNDCGKIKHDFTNLNPKAYHFIKASEEVLDRFKNLSYYPLSSHTARQDSLGRSELIWLYEQKY